MSEQKPVSLAGQQARIKFEAADDGFVVLFGPDVSMRWMGAINTSSNARADLHPEITGSLNTEEDYSAIKGAELILDDEQVFTISFHDAKYFSAYQSINSSNRAY